MDKITDYLIHAEECRRLAKSATDLTHKEALLRMAQTWADLATARNAELARRDRLSRDGTLDGNAPEDKS